MRRWWRVPDERLGEVPVAFCVSAADGAEICAWARERAGGLQGSAACLLRARARGSRAHRQRQGPQGRPLRACPAPPRRGRRDAHRRDRSPRDRAADRAGRHVLGLFERRAALGGQRGGRSRHPRRRADAARRHRGGGDLDPHCDRPSLRGEPATLPQRRRRGHGPPRAPPPADPDREPGRPEEVSRPLQGPRHGLRPHRRQRRAR